MTGKGRLFRKYAVLFVGLVGGALLASGGIAAWFSYQENRAALARIQKEKALAAAAVIRQFIREIENQIEWTTHSSFLSGKEGFEQRRIDFLRLLRQSPAITRIGLLDAAGREQLSVSRLSMDVVGSGVDHSQKPEFLRAAPRQLYVSPVYFRRNSEPYTTVSMAGARKSAGVTVAEVNLKFIWDEISQIRTGRRGYAYLVDSRGLLIAHPRIELVLRKTNLSKLSQVARAMNEPSGADDSEIDEAVASNVQGERVLTAYARIQPLAWTVFVESPLDEAFEPLYESLARTAVLVLIGLELSVLAGLVLARRVTVPIHALQEGASRIGAGDLASRIEVNTGDELEALAGQFNDMAARLQASYSTLEQKVDERTRELAQSIRELTALGEVSRAVSSTLDLKTVFTTVVARAAELSGSDAGAIFRYDRNEEIFDLAEAFGVDSALTGRLQSLRIDADDTAMGEAVRTGEPIQTPDLTAEAGAAVRALLTEAGYRSGLVVPLIGPTRTIGALVMLRRAEGAFSPNTVDLMRTFANQSVLAIQNARLFREIEQKGRELEIASQHKSQFLANMSHELRTPMNAILGYTELVLDEIYGPTPEKVREVLDRVQTNGRHLLALINDILDLSKIEAGELALTLDDFSIPDMVHTVVTATESLATEKKLALESRLPNDLPVARGDERRLAQVLLNLVGNAIKFTDEGRVEISVAARNGTVEFEVSDTGPGIAADQQARIFEEFHQVDNSITKEKGGTGLGLAIAKRIVEMHGGRIWIDSEPGRGSTFGFEVPLRVEKAQVMS